MRTTASRIVRGITIAAVPVLMVGCSASSDPGTGAAKPKPSKSASPTLAPARFTGLPAPCKVLSKDTVRELVPKAKSLSGDTAKSSDLDSRAGCSWNGLDGFQYRWLEVSFRRSDSVQGVGSAETQARTAYTQLKASAATPDGLEKGQTAAIRVVPDLGQESQLVSALVKRDGDDYRDATVVARKENVVVTVSYNGAGFEDSKVPGAKEIEQGAVKAARAALAAVR